MTILAQAAALAVQLRINRGYRGIGWWLAGSAAFAAGFIFLLLNAGRGYWWLGILGNPALMSAHMGLMVGTLRFLDLPERRPRALLALAGAVAVYYAFLFAVPSISARTVAVCGAIALFDLATARALLGRRGHRFPQPARFTAAVFVVHGCFLLALANLAANAAEAMGETGGLLRIQVGIGPAAAIPARNRFPVGWQPQASDHAWLEVADSGVGIDPAAMENLCGPFYSTKFTGRGQGLSVVLGIAQAHGGGLTVESRPGAGSAFRIHFPVAG